MSGENTGGNQVVRTVDNVAEILGTLVPTIGAIGGAVRLLLSAARPSDAKKAQAYDAASAELKTALGDLSTAINAFEEAKRQAAANAGTPVSGNAVGAMTAHGETKPSDS